MDARNRQVLETWIGELSGATPVEFSDARGAEVVPLRHVAKNDVSFVVGELIIALMRRGGLSTAEGNASRLKLVKHDGNALSFFGHGRRSESDTMLFAN
jgi:hypothetical protein